LPIHVPPLRERPEDIPDLVDYFLADATKNEGFAEIPSITEQGMEKLMRQPWPGNVRQLRNIVQRILVLSSDKNIGSEAVEFALAADGPALPNQLLNEPGFPVGLESTVTMNFSDARDEFERVFVLQKLKENEYNVARTAQALGMYPSNLHAKIKKFNIQLER